MIALANITILDRGGRWIPIGIGTEFTVRVEGSTWNAVAARAVREARKAVPPRCRIGTIKLSITRL